MILVLKLSKLFSCSRSWVHSIKYPNLWVKATDSDSPSYFSRKYHTFPESRELDIFKLYFIFCPPSKAKCPIVCIGVSAPSSKTPLPSFLPSPPTFTKCPSHPRFLLGNPPYKLGFRETRSPLRELRCFHEP